MWLVILLIIIFFFLLVGIITLRRLGGGSFPWFQFYIKGRESGFSFKEVNLLRKVAVENRLENPVSLFWSIKQLDRSIRGIMLKFRSKGSENDPQNEQFLSKLFDFRKRVEFKLPKYKLGIKTSRKIVPRQRLQLTLTGGETFTSTVVENLRKYLAISYPEGPKMPPGFSWKGQKIEIYFWRPDDAGYVFETKVLEDFYDRKYPILHIAHSDSLLRSQKRESVRAQVNKNAYIYPLKTIESANEFEEKSAGLRSRLMDISEGGAAVLVGGKAKVGLPLKIQFSLGKNTIVMCGTVKGVSFNQKKNQSVLHIQAVPLSFKNRNKVLTYVYDLFGEREAEKKIASNNIMKRK